MAKRSKKKTEVNQYSNPEGIRRSIDRARVFLRPPPNYTPSEWAEANIRIPMGNAIPGPIRFDNAPYQIEPLDMFANPEVQRITLMWGAQTGKTQILNCAMGYFVAHDPSSQIMMQPSQGDLHTWLETKFNPMVESNDVLSDRIAKPRSREGVNNQTMKSYPGGFLMFAWSGSPRTMRGRSAPKIFCDEVDGYEYTAEGHPVSLLWQRAATFGDQRKLLVTSTPTIKDSSFVESSFIDGDQRHFWIPCPHCNQFITLEWKYVQWDDGDPETARYVCCECGSLISDGEKRVALRSGEWRAEKPTLGHVSYHLSELYSSFRRWRDIVRSFMEKKATNDLQSFINVSLAETWDESGGDSIDPIGLSDRREPMEKIPDEVGILVAGVDCQDNRLEATIIGIGKDEELFVFKHLSLYGDPSTPQLWNSLDSILFASYEREDGQYMNIRGACVDSGGHFTNSVYQYCKKHAGRRVFAIKGVGGEGKPISGRPSKNNIAKCPLFSIGVDTAKDLIFSRLRIQEQGAGHVRFSDYLDDEYFRGLTAEKIVTKYEKGFKRRIFQKVYKRNEPLDCMVYAYACYVILGINVNTLVDKMTVTAGKTPIPEEKPKENKRKRSFVPSTGKNFVNSWR